MSSPVCDRAALVEAMFDGRLGPSERASTERHLKSCTSCAELLSDLSSLQETLRSSSGTVPPLEHQRARLALLRRTAGPSTTKRRPAALLVAVLVTLPLAVWASTSSLSPLRWWDTAPTPTTPIAPVTPAIGRKHAPSEPLPPAPPTASASATVDSIALATSATSDTSPTVPLQAPATPLRALPNLSSAPTPSHPRWARDASGEKRAAAVSSAEPSQASRDFAEAMKALSRGDFSAGASKLESFVSAHPRDPRVEDAAYLEAIALERAGRITDAKAAAGRYLAAYPDGAHRTQARRIVGD